MKIKVVCNWTDDLSIMSRFIRNYITDKNFDPELIITHEEDYDALLVFNAYDRNKIRVSKEKVFGFIMEPSWSYNWDKSIGDYCGKVFFHDLSLVPTYQSFIEHPSMMLYHSTNFLNEFESNFPKTKRISMVVRNFGGYGENQLYHLRMNLVHSILQTDLPIDIYGKNWHSIDSRIKGEVINKSDALKDYEFSIAIENSREKGYVSEKFFDCILCDTVPIYFGAPNVQEVYPNAFINLDTSNAISQLSQILKNQEYSKYFLSIQRAKNKYMNSYNIYNVIKGLLK